ncbi:hypothetical protein [Rhizosphaericola mali]|uniref:CCDC81-like prokaryotic HU domain-containing protein n=1 Tax=Rhizosphaericola mali TaxID=2545455 RepID=A0A5P2G2X5_9BACT|nr:hypothetical protein [Rhizosphaericola mali]QES88469.1 hypothetical protein E0W69_007265 [Rhizosphaericola mali]
MHDYLIQNKSLSLEKIGIVTLKGGSISIENGQTIPEATFEFNKQVTTTPEFVAFAKEVLNKNPSIVASDIEYFLEESRQLMNIGTGVLMINGIGYIHSLKTGGYSFSQNPISGFRDGEGSEKALSADIYDRAEAEESVNRKRIQSNRAKPQVNYMAIVVVVVLLGIVGYGIYYFVNKPKSNAELLPEKVEQVATESADTNKENISVDTSKAKALPMTKVNTDIYKFVFEITKDAQRAHARIATLKGYGNAVDFDSVQTSQGLFYRLYSPIPKTADTTKVKDSLFKYFQRPIQIAKYN